jgi:cytochrome bd-type quinol oxidase subunit 2
LSQNVGTELTIQRCVTSHKSADIIIIIIIIIIVVVVVVVVFVQATFAGDTRGFREPPFGHPCYKAPYLSVS